MDIKNLPKPENDLQFTLYVIVAAGLGAWFLWLKFGDKKKEDIVKNETLKLFQQELEKIKLRIPKEGKPNGPTETAIFRTETVTGFTAFRERIDGLEKHYDDHIRRLEDSTLPILFEQVNNLTNMVVELKTALRIHLEDRNVL